MSAADNDDELMSRFQRDRDLAAFERLFARHKDALFRFLLRLVANPAAAEDASQQTWLKVIEVARNGSWQNKRNAAFRTWLFTLARNHVIDEHKRKFAVSRTVPLPEGELPEGSIGVDRQARDPAEQAVQEQLARRVQAAMVALPFEQREVLALWAVGIDPSEIATITSAPRETVLSRKKYALAKLRAALGDVLPVEQNA
jgi:RNA polymerase sigma factor (sigma-70 family)